MIRVVIASILTAVVAAVQAPADSSPPEPVGEASQALRLTREQAIALAVAANPQVTEAREQVEQARARVAEATALPDPAIATTLEEERNLLEPRTATSKDIGLGFVVPFPSKLHLSGQVARAALRSAEFSFAQL